MCVRYFTHLPALADRQTPAPRFRRFGITSSYSFSYNDVVLAHPTYPNDTLALVLVELRHPVAEAPAPPALAMLKETLSQWTPIAEQEEGRQIDFQTGELSVISNKKLVARDRRTAIAFRNDAMTVEVTDYPGWDKFWPIVRAMVSARQDIDPVDGCTRIGLRYINEIRAPLQAGTGWKQWVSERLLGPGPELAELGLTTSAQQHVVQCEGTYPGDSLTLRYGAARGAVIKSTPLLRRRTEPSSDGDFFLIDIDSAWTDPRGGVPALDLALLDQAAERLHTPINPLFESLITNDLRTQVLQQLPEQD